MSVYLGNQGCVELKRQGEPFPCVLTPGEVDVDARRFSVDFDPGHAEPEPSPLTTGDYVSITTVTPSGGSAPNLVLVDGMSDPNVTRWVHVDQTGGIRLYDKFELAVTGGKENALELEEPTANQNIIIDIANAGYNCVAQMTEWEITTNRDTIDLTELGSEYRQFYDQGLISGQGSLNAFWDFQWEPCDDDYSQEAETANYFANLVIRFCEGAKFAGVFFIYLSDDAAVWYETEAIVTSVAMAFEPGQPIRAKVDFITTGQIWLKQGEPPSFLLQEGGVVRSDQEILLEQPPGALTLELSD